MTRWAALASAQQSLTSCGKTWYLEWRGRGGDASQQFTSCPGYWGLCRVHVVVCALCGIRGMMIETSRRTWGAWLQTERSHGHLVQVRHQSVRHSSLESDEIPRFQWKSGTFVVSENCSLCLSSSAVKWGTMPFWGYSKLVFYYVTQAILRW